MLKSHIQNQPAAISGEGRPHQPACGPARRYQTSVNGLIRSASYRGAGTMNRPERLEEASTQARVLGRKEVPVDEPLACVCRNPALKSGRVSDYTATMRPILTLNPHLDPSPHAHFPYRVRPFEPFHELAHRASRVPPNGPHDCLPATGCAFAGVLFDHVPTASPCDWRTGALSCKKGAQIARTLILRM